MPHAHHKRELRRYKPANVLLSQFLFSFLFHRAFAVERHKCRVRIFILMGKAKDGEWNGRGKKRRNHTLLKDSDYKRKRENDFCVGFCLALPIFILF